MGTTRAKTLRFYEVKKSGKKFVRKKGGALGEIHGTWDMGSKIAHSIAQKRGEIIGFTYGGERGMIIAPSGSGLPWSK